MKFALITGTSRGIGVALAEALLERGWRVTGCARGPAPESLQREGYAHFEVDLSDRDATVAAFDPERPELADLARAERPALVHNAAVLGTDPISGLELGGVVDALTVNVATPLWLTGWFLRHTAPAAELRVVEVSSGAAKSAYPGWSVYCASKAALLRMGEVLAVEAQEVEELRGRRLAVLSYAPHVVATDMQAEIRATGAARFPRHQRFLDLHANGELVPAEAPAGDLARKIDDEAPWPDYEVTRYEPR
ncbi:MAG: SDR family NAD(P)-dependent oxidoreductase [Planctomycetota bacterium]